MREKCFEVPPSAGRGRHSECLIIGPRVQLDSSRREGFPKSNFLAQGEREKRSRDSGGQKGGKIKAHLKRRGGKKEIDWIRHWTWTRTQIRRKKAAVGVRLLARRCVEMTHEREREIATTDRKGERPQRSSIRETNT